MNVMRSLVCVDRLEILGVAHHVIIGMYAIAAVDVASGAGDV